VSKMLMFAGVGIPSVVQCSHSDLYTTRLYLNSAVTQAVQAKLGRSLPGPWDHVMYVLEACYVDCGW
jgi:hypothetical protein